MNDESIDINLSFINTDYFSVSVRDGAISVIGRITKLEMEKFIKAQIIVNNARFRRDSGWQCGSDRWNIRRISVPTEKEISDVKEENLRETLIYSISSFDFKRLSTDELKQVYNILKGKENGRA